MMAQRIKPEILKRLQQTYPNLRVVRIQKTKEKPMPLISGSVLLMEN